MRPVTFDELDGLIGEELGVSEWYTLDQPRIAMFAECTEDHQWIHTDVTRAASGPFGTTIAHGYLTLSMVPVMVNQIWKLQGVAMGINYGLNRVRFLAPVKSGSRVRARAKILAVDVKDDARQVTTEVTLDLEGSERPAAVVETVTRYVLQAA